MDERFTLGPFELGRLNGLSGDGWRVLAGVIQQLGGELVVAAGVRDGVGAMSSPRLRGQVWAVTRTTSRWS